MTRHKLLKEQLRKNILPGNFTAQLLVIPPPPPPPCKPPWPKTTWDHVSFAFYFPEEDDRLIIPPNFCEIKTKVAIGSYPESRKQTEKRSDSQKKANEKIVKELKEKNNLELEKTKSDLEKVTSDLEKFNFEKK